MANAYDPEAFRALGHEVVEMLADYLARAQSGACGPVLPWQEPDAMRAAWRLPEAPNGGEEPLALLRRVVDEANHLHHPGYIGHQVSAPLPLAALCDLVASFLNNGMAVYEMGTSATAMEQEVVAWMARSLGMPPGADGVITSGGSAGNLTALLAARHAARQRHGDVPFVFLVSQQAHYSVARALRIMGCGPESVVEVPVDDAFRLRPDALPGAAAEARARGFVPVAVSASACSTATGACDPLEAVADFCAREGLWLHVDAAHGGAACLSPKYRDLTAGIERADSVVWDAHKMLQMPALASAVIFRDGAASYLPFEAEASYLYERQAREEWYNLGHRTLECTKTMMCLKVYCALRCCGEDLFARHVTACYDLARDFARMLAQTPGFEVAVPPQSNIVCFRYVPEDTADPDALQSAIRRRIIAEGQFYIVQTTLPRGVYLRATVINPMTGLADLEALIAAIRYLGDAILSAP